MIKNIVLTSVTCFILTFSANAQDVPPCPQGFVCLTRAAAQAALEAGDKAKALETELKAVQDAYALQKKVLDDMRIEFARTSGELTAHKTHEVRMNAIMDILIKNSRKKSIGLIAF